jgi:hypothetical protein
MTTHLPLSSLPGLSIDVSRSEIHSTTIELCNTGVELRAPWFTGQQRYRYTLKFNFLRQNNHQAIIDELDKLHDFYLEKSGRLISFWLVDPVTGSDVAVRFEEELDIERILSGVYTSSVTLISCPGETPPGGTPPI